MNKLAAILIVCTAFAFQELGAQEDCLPIDSFVKDVEGGKSEFLFNSKMEKRW